MTDRSAEDPMLLAALGYAREGWAVLPIAKGKKSPAIKGGYKSATADSGELIRLWKSRPGAGVAIATGDVSGLLVVDVDPRNGGNEDLEELERQHGPLPETVAVHSGGDGRHYYFSLEPDGAPPSRALAKGIDLKSNGGYIVAPPTIHPNGKQYTWLNAPNDIALAPAPDWLLQTQLQIEPFKPSPERSAPTKSADSDTLNDGSETPLGRLFAELSLLGNSSGNGKRSVICPWQKEHTTGQLLDTSTVVFPANKPNGIGGFHCVHSHCRNRDSVAAFKELTRQRDQQIGNAGWMSELKRSEKTDAIRRTFRNIWLITKHDDTYGKQLRADEMHVTILLGADEMTDSAISRIRVDLDARYGVEASEADVMRAVHLVAEENKFHPVRDFLNQLTWDSVPRLRRVAEEILAARITNPEELALLNIMITAWFLTLVGRPLRPGIKVDTALILQGLQGTGKSTFFRVLAGEWFSDTEMGLDKDGMMLLAGAWVCEWAELENVMGRDTVSRVKAFLTSTEDRFRPPFGRTMMTIKRSGVIVGSTNLQDFLHDPTGSRRFWVIPVGKINTTLLGEWREQLLAEAVVRFKKGERYWLSEDEENRRLKFVDQFAESDPWEEDILAYAQQQTQVRIPDILRDVLDLDKGRQSRREEHRVAAVLRRAGWERSQLRIDGKVQRVWLLARKTVTTGTAGTSGPT